MVEQYSLAIKLYYALIGSLNCLNKKLKFYVKIYINY